MCQDLADQSEISEHRIGAEEGEVDPSSYIYGVGGDWLGYPGTVPNFTRPVQNVSVYHVHNVTARVADPDPGPFWSEPDPENFHRIRILSVPSLAM